MHLVLGCSEDLEDYNIVKSGLNGREAMITRNGMRSWRKKLWTRWNVYTLLVKTKEINLKLYFPNY